MNFSTTKIKRLKPILENINPSEVFSKEISMTRMEISKDLSSFIKQEIYEADNRLTDEFCETWLLFDYDFISKTADDNIIKLRNASLNEIIKKAGFKISEKKEEYLSNSDSSVSKL